jgi:hypothetical protein
MLVGFRERIPKSGYEQFITGVPDIEKDWRCCISYLPWFPCLNLSQKISEFEGTINILKESNNFKNLGHGNLVANTDLPLMVIGCSLAYKRDDAINSGGWPEIYSGYGMDDFGFGLNMIANGIKIIPVPNCVNYVLTEPKDKLSSLKLNKIKYLEYANGANPTDFYNRDIEFLGKRGLKSYFQLNQH